jgi:hypothetical protein
VVAGLEGRSETGVVIRVNALFPFRRAQRTAAPAGVDAERAQPGFIDLEAVGGDPPVPDSRLRAREHRTKLGF